MVQRYSTFGKGRRGERAAGLFLIQKGYHLLELNFKSPSGEVDIVAVKGDIISFCEVKAWESYRYESLEYAINRKKKMRIIHTSVYWLQQRGFSAYQKISYDVIYCSNCYGIIRHIKGAFGVEDG